jgi:biofilm PGA synthesis N-glycosyltransferase PgaC
MFSSFFTAEFFSGTFAVVVSRICFGYPFVMSWYWIAGSLIYYFYRERHQPLPDKPPKLKNPPMVSVLLPCFNEQEQLNETVTVLMQSQYPNFEVIAINDGSTDQTLAILHQLQKKYANLRVANLVKNQGKSTALNTGLMLSKGDLIVCIDGDALLDPHAMTWFVRRFMLDKTLGGITGNPRIRNRSSLLGQLQVGEFSSIVGMIKRTQSIDNALFTVSGVICAFRKIAILDAGQWTPQAITDDVDLTLRIEIRGWKVTFEPNALCWILMPETLWGLWRQRLRWSEGGAQACMRVFRGAMASRSWGLMLVISNFFISTVWAFAMVIWFTLINIAQLLSPEPLEIYKNFIPQWWGVLLACTYLIQCMLGMLLDRRYEKNLLREFVWIVWYPLAYWALQTCSCVVGFYKALVRPANRNGTWISPDRGIH